MSGKRGLAYRTADARCPPRRMSLSHGVQLPAELIAFRDPLCDDSRVHLISNWASNPCCHPRLAALVVDKIASFGALATGTTSRSR